MIFTYVSYRDFKPVFSRKVRTLQRLLPKWEYHLIFEIFGIYNNNSNSIIVERVRGRPRRAYTIHCSRYAPSAVRTPLLGQPGAATFPLSFPSPLLIDEAQHGPVAILLLLNTTETDPKRDSAAGSARPKRIQANSIPRTSRAKTHTGLPNQASSFLGRTTGSRETTVPFTSHYQSPTCSLHFLHLFLH